MRYRLARIRQLERLDPETHHAKIHRISSTQEFPWDYGRGLEVAVWRTSCVPSISELLDYSREFTDRTQKRYDDTRILLGEVVAHGYDSDRGRQAIRQINRAHQRFDISNDDMLYVLSTFIYEPVRWIDMWAWRKVTSTEKLAAFYFFREVGRRMNIRSLPTDYKSFERFNVDYEHRSFRYAEANHRVGTAILELLSSWYSRPLRPVVRATLLARLDEPARQALGLPAPAAWAPWLNRLVLRGHAFTELIAPSVAARLMTRPVARTYPHGYDLAKVGPSLLDSGTAAAQDVRDRNP